MVSAPIFGTLRFRANARRRASTVDTSGPLTWILRQPGNENGPSRPFSPSSQRGAGLALPGPRSAQDRLEERLNYPGGRTSGEFSVGGEIAGYRLDELIGQGGMAVVWRAYDARLDRQVALKIMATALARDEAFRQRFIRESRAAAAVDDPHIIPVFGAGEASGVLYIAMRFVRGGDVRTLVDREGPLPPARAADIIAQAAGALDAAHARGLVHRDVKPANLLLEPRQSVDMPDHVYLSDFGLTKNALSVGGLTAASQFLGTLDYAAPEQIEGRPVDGRTDQYALGCAAFELLTGVPPFSRDNGAAIMYAHLSEPPPSVLQRRRDLPPAVDQVLGRALAKQAQDRYESCLEFAGALRRALGIGSSQPDRPPTQVVRPDPPRTQVVKPGRRGAEATAAASVPPEQREPTMLAGRGSDPPYPPAAPVRRPTRYAGPDEHLTDPRRPDTVVGPAQPRSRLRSPAVLGGAAAVVVLGAVGGVLASGALGGHHSDNPPAHHAAALSLPVCSTATAHAATLSSPVPQLQQIGGQPFGVAATADGKFAFVSTGNAIEVFSTTGATPALLRTIGVPGAKKGVALTSDDRYLIAADQNGAAILNVTAAEQGTGNPVLGTLTSTGGGGAVEVQISNSGKYVFVTLQSSGEVAVFNLQQALAAGPAPSDFVGYVPIGVNTEPVGMSLSPDGKLLYVAALQSGTLQVISTQKAEHDPARAVLTTLQAGCGAARVITDGDLVWVSDRQANTLLAFRAAKLLTKGAKALVAVVHIGENPLGETLVDGGRKILVADGNLQGASNETANVAVIDTTAALAGRPALLGYLPAGLQPREFAISPDGKTALLTNQKSGQLEVIDLTKLP
jgi:serine/threonine protein kinase/DNA-binding beta-propeller fold protein YncE